MVGLDEMFLRPGMTLGLGADGLLQVDWNVPFEALVAFKKQHGHTNVPEKTMYSTGQGGENFLFA